MKKIFSIVLFFCISLSVKSQGETDKHIRLLSSKVVVYDNNYLNLKNEKVMDVLWLELISCRKICDSIDFTILKNVEHIGIYYSDIENHLLLFEKLSLVPNLKSLELIQCDINSLPSQLLLLKKLDYLKIEGGKKKKLRISLDCHQLKALTKLWVSGYTINKESILSIVNMPFLQELTLESCSLKKFPAELSSATNLIMIDLSDNPMKRFPERLSGFNNLRLLSFCSNKYNVLLPDSIAINNRFIPVLKELK